jgi:hypothetical protein
MEVRLPKLDYKGKGKAAVVVESDDNELDWGSQDENPEDVYDDIATGIAIKPTSWYDQFEVNNDPYGGVFDDHIGPQVSSLQFGMIGSLIIKSQGQLPHGLTKLPLGSSLGFCICNINTSLSGNCSKCEQEKKRAKASSNRALDGEIEFIGDTGASATFTFDINDFFVYYELDKSLVARTANKGVPLNIKGKGIVILKHQSNRLGGTVYIKLDPVYYIPDLSIRLMSLGEWLQQGCTLRGTKEKLAILQGSVTNLSLYPKTPGDTIYWLKATVLCEQASLVSMSTIFAVNFDLMRRRMGHPSNDVLRKAVKHTDNFQ